MKYGNQNMCTIHMLYDKKIPSYRFWVVCTTVFIPIPKMLVDKDDEQKWCISRRTTKAYCRMVRRTTTIYSIYAIRFVYCCFRDWYENYGSLAGAEVASSAFVRSIVTFPFVATQTSSKDGQEKITPWLNWSSVIVVLSRFTSPKISSAVISARDSAEPITVTSIFSVMIEYSYVLSGWLPMLPKISTGIQ